jgi:hypothetical protein
MRVDLCFDWGGGMVWDYLIRKAESDEHDRAPEPLATHAYLRFRDEKGQLSIIEAVPPKAHLLLNPPVRPRARAYKLAEGDEALAVYAYASRRIGTLYDLPGLLVALGYCERKEQDHFYQSHHDWVFCSELSTLAIRQIRPCLPDLDADIVTPAHLEAWAVSEGLPSSTLSPAE